MKLATVIASLERRLAVTFEEYKKEHPGTHLTQSSPEFNEIGKTKSGKSIYSHFEHPEHEKFDFQDHLDAAKAHMTEGKHMDREHHHHEAKKHTQAAEKQILEGLTLAGE